jgi:hypothetical protein
MSALESAVNVSLVCMHAHRQEEPGKANKAPQETIAKRKEKKGFFIFFICPSNQRKKSLPRFSRHSSSFARKTRSRDMGEIFSSITTSD